MIPISQIETNKGQIEGLPKNPRLIRDEHFKKLLQSIKDNPEMLYLRELLVYPHQGRYITIGGNMRLMAMRDIGYTEAPCKVIPEGTSIEQLKAYTIKDNAAYGEWDYDLLANEWDYDMLDNWGLSINLDEATEGEEEKERKKREKVEREIANNLRKNWVVPPMSVFDSRNGEWQDRKRLWRQLVDNRTIGEGREETLYKSPEMRYPHLYADSREEREKLGISFREYIEKYATDEDLKLDGAFAAGTSLFDPVLAEVVMKWFAPKGGKIIDPFGGEPTKGIVAGVLGFQYTAVEFRQEQVDTNRKACEGYPNVRYFCGDSNNIDTIVEDTGFDLCFTSPPYYDLEVYSKEDMSALGTYEEFMQQYYNIFKKCVDKLKDKGFLVVKVGEIRNKKTTVYRNFVGDNITIFKDLGLHYWNEIILVQPIGTSAMRAEKNMETRKVQHVHQNILVFKKDMKQQVEKVHENLLVFYKGDPKAVKCAPLDYPDLEETVKAETHHEND